MSTDAVVIDRADRFRPRKPAANKDAEIAVAADVNMLLKIETWAATRRQIVEHVARPLFPEVRKTALDLVGVIDGHPPAPR